MAYKFFKVEFHSVQELFDLKNPIEIFKLFVDNVGANRIRGYNFNKYYDPNHGIIHPHIDIRMNFIYVEQRRAWTEIQRVAQQLLASNDIRSWSSRLEPWNEPAFVVKAHETGTKCAFEFKEQLDSNNQTYRRLVENPDDFMWLFAVSLLKHSGFRPYIAWTYLRSSIPTDIDRIANTCCQILLNAIGNRRPKPDFLERFLHTFFNCTTSSEQKLVNLLIASDAYRKLADSWRRTL